ncbi:MAG: gene transfer agent family protein [Pontixanthobacter sp.]
MSAANARANAMRGEAAITIAGTPHKLRPTFAALVAAEEELGSLFDLVDRAANGKLRLAEVAMLFWHCLATEDDIARDAVGDAVLAMGLAQCTPPLRIILGQIVQGSG